MVKYCTECGEEIQENSSFCQNCGKSTNNEKYGENSSIGLNNQINTSKDIKPITNKKISKADKSMIGALAVPILIIICICFFIGVMMLSQGITPGVSSGSQYEELASLKANYTELESKFNSTKQVIFSSSSNAKEQAYINAELELIRSNSAISDVESALKSGKSSNEVDKRIKTAKEKLNIANQAYNNL